MNYSANWPRFFSGKFRSRLPAEHAHPVAGAVDRGPRNLKHSGDALDSVVAGARRRLAASFNALLVLVLRFRGSLLGALLGVLLGAQSLRLMLFLGFFLVDDLCEELLHLLGHASG
ncbi:hypothetical protein M2428_002950 [Arthrobacter sp. ES3-54]|nr:hypothetical protein [Arthrobacter sp. ES3-54]